jgi:hypothetical protein
MKAIVCVVACLSLHIALTSAHSWVVCTDYRGMYYLVLFFTPQHQYVSQVCAYCVSTQATNHDMMNLNALDILVHGKVLPGALSVLTEASTIR